MKVHILMARNTHDHFGTPIVAAFVTNDDNNPSALAIAHAARKGYEIKTLSIPIAPTTEQEWRSVIEAEITAHEE